MVFLWTNNGNNDLLYYLFYKTNMKLFILAILALTLTGCVGEEKIVCYKLYEFEKKEQNMKICFDEDNIKSMVEDSIGAIDVKECSKHFNNYKNGNKEVEACILKSN